MKILLFQIGSEIFGMELKNIVRIAFYTELGPGSEDGSSENGKMIKWQKNPIPKMISNKKENRIFSGIAVWQDNMIPLIDHSVLFQSGLGCF